MTVGVATMGNNGMLFFAADRMLTRGATQTEPASAKIYNFGNDVPVTVVWAGSAAVFGEVIQSFAALLNTANPPTVQKVVDLYCDCFSRMMGTRAERAVLTRLGLTRETLVSSKVSNDRADRLVREVTDFCLNVDESVHVIIGGHDLDGTAHIWTVQDDVPWCNDVEGFATIGMGADHADAQLRFAGYTRFATRQEALIMAYLAKRRAEIAPGVGKFTDLIMRDPGDRSWMPIPDTWKERFDEEHQHFAQAERDALSQAVTAGVGAILEMAGPPEQGQVAASSAPEQQAPKEPQPTEQT
jgi:hypothetical protein